VDGTYESGGDLVDGMLMWMMSFMMVVVDVVVDVRVDDDRHV
jgi:hypothetical protein